MPSITTFLNPKSLEFLAASDRTMVRRKYLFWLILLVIFLTDSLDCFFDRFFCWYQFKWQTKNQQVPPFIFTINSECIIVNSRFTDLWLVLVRSKVKPPKLKPKRRKRRRPDAPRGGSNTTDDLSTLFKPLVASVDPTLIHKSVLYILFLEE